MKREDEERLQRLVHERTFERLSVDDQEFVIGILGTEEKFAALQKIEHALNASGFRSELEPDIRVLDSLKTRMQHKSNSESVWYAFLYMKIPAYLTALFVIGSSGLVGWIALNSQTSKTIVGATIVRSDTVYVSKVDTVFREKVIYKQVRVAVPSFKEIQTAGAFEKTSPASTGVSMKDKEELNKLLVSGSD